MTITAEQPSYTVSLAVLLSRLLLNKVTPKTTKWTMTLERGTYVKASITNRFGQPIEVTGEVHHTHGEKVHLKGGGVILQDDIINMGGTV
jgi:hypothetical protein